MIDGRSLAALAVRADQVIATLLPTGGDVLVVSHGHFLRELATRWIEWFRRRPAGSSCGPRRSPSSAGSTTTG
jgi:broad specificity phosphatase PhoE